jgi:RNA polymerase sigma-70 factor (ECF subfamily)
VVQETFLEAHRDFGRFQGDTEADLLAWLRRILLHNLANVTRHYRETGKRQVGLEVSLGEVADDDLRRPGRDDTPSPGSALVAGEQSEELRRALGQLPEDYRQVVYWRSYERLTFEEIGRRLERSAEAARKLWARAIEKLQETLEPPDASA